MMYLPSLPRLLMVAASCLLASWGHASDKVITSDGLTLSGKIIDPDGVFKNASYVSLSCKHSGHSDDLGERVIELYAYGKQWSLRNPKDGAMVPLHQRYHL